MVPGHSCSWAIRDPRESGGTRRLEWGPVPLVMGIVNVTPDSFSDGGRFRDVSQAVAHAHRLVQEGADVVDLGGESVRPGAEPVPLDEELRRVMPVLEALCGGSAGFAAPISIDTYKAEVARRALDAGASIINDVAGLTDPAMRKVAAESQAGVIVMHMQGTPPTMQLNPRYDDVVREVCDFLAGQVSLLEREGVPPERVALDPGIGFGKKRDHNLRLLRGLPCIVELGRPVCVGVSRKAFIGRLIDRDVQERIYGTLGAELAAAARGAAILRAHEVRPLKEALATFMAV